MLIKTILNRIHPLQSFVYSRCAQTATGIRVTVRPRKGSRPRCGGCGARGSVYDRARVLRTFDFVPMWGLPVVLSYAMRRVDCSHCGVTTERVPWAEGKQGACNVYRLFLARWAKRLAWAEVAAVFGVSWGVVFRAVEWVVQYGLAHRSLDDVRAIGFDEIAVWTGQRFLTVVYQIDTHARRLIWMGRERTRATVEQFFDAFGAERAAKLQFVASDLWSPFITIAAKRAGQALHVLDRYHIAARLNEAIDRIRASEAKALARKGFQPVLKHTRWCFLKRKENLTPRQRTRLRDVLRHSLKTVRAYLLKQAFDAFWTYKSPAWASWFFDRWCTRALRSRLSYMQRLARTLRKHKPLLLNWLRAKGAVSRGAVEGMNLNAKLAVRKARGFRTITGLETALYHQLGHLPEPQYAHRFC